MYLSVCLSVLAMHKQQTVFMCRLTALLVLLCNTALKNLHLWYDTCCNPVTADRWQAASDVIKWWFIGSQVSSVLLAPYNIGHWLHCYRQARRMLGILTAGSMTWSLPLHCTQEFHIVAQTAW